mgnify:CR=1 FL=1
MYSHGRHGALHDVRLRPRRLQMSKFRDDAVACIQQLREDEGASSPFSFAIQVNLH